MANGLSVQMLDANTNILAEKCLVAVLEDEQGKRSAGRLVVSKRERWELALNSQCQSS